MVETINMKQEIETKLDVPTDVDKAVFIRLLRCFIQQRGWDILKDRQVQRHYEYFDTDALDFYQNNQTLRIVTRLDQPNETGAFRHDYKYRENEAVYETDPIWTDVKLPVDALLTRFGLEEHLGKVKNVAKADTLHTKMLIQKDYNLVEVALDEFDVHKGKPFIELECELKNGCENLLEHLSNDLGRFFDLGEPEQPHKYLRVIDTLTPPDTYNA